MAQEIARARKALWRTRLRYQGNLAVSTALGAITQKHFIAVA